MKRKHEQRNHRHDGKDEREPHAPVAGPAGENGGDRDGGGRQAAQGLREQRRVIPQVVADDRPRTLPLPARPHREGLSPDHLDVWLRPEEGLLAEDARDQSGEAERHDEIDDRQDGQDGREGQPVACRLRCRGLRVSGSSREQVGRDQTQDERRGVDPRGDRQRREDTRRIPAARPPSAVRFENRDLGEEDEQRGDAVHLDPDRSEDRDGGHRVERAGEKANCVAEETLPEAVREEDVDDVGGGREHPSTEEERRVVQQDHPSELPERRAALADPASQQVHGVSDRQQMGEDVRREREVALEDAEPELVRLVKEIDLVGVEEVGQSVPQEQPARDGSHHHHEGEHDQESRPRDAVGSFARAHTRARPTVCGRAAERVFAQM